VKIQVVRQACCSQDDQIGPLEMAFDVKPDCRLDEFLSVVQRSGFLQFSSSHSEMSCRFAGREVARVFSPYRLVGRKTRFAFAPETPVHDIPTRGIVEFDFDRPSTAVTAVGMDEARPPDSMLRRALRASLAVLLFVSGVLSVFALVVGLTFGFNLWRWDRPGVTVGWLVLVLLPLAVYRVVKNEPRSMRVLAVCAIVFWVPPLYVVGRAFE
jgi:hypothetical protein